MLTSIFRFILVLFYQKINIYKKKKKDRILTLCLQFISIFPQNRKEAAHVFHEMLVLKTKGFIDLLQQEPYADILISEPEEIS